MTVPAETFSLSQTGSTSGQTAQALNLTVADSVAITPGALQQAARLGRTFNTQKLDGSISVHVVDPSRCVFLPSGAVQKYVLQQSKSGV